METLCSSLRIVSADLAIGVHGRQWQRTNEASGN
jgi:hypothetical protein